MADLFASGRVIDAILCLVVLEALALVAWRARVGRRLELRPLLCNLASGAALMLAVRAALTEAGWIVIAACLAASFVAHLGELHCRLRGTIRRNCAVPLPGTSPERVAFHGHS